MSSQRVLITGGSGFLGINLVRHLLATDYQVRTLDLLPFDYSEQELIESVVGDVRKVEDVEKAMKKVDFVVHTAAALPLYSEEDIYSTEVEGTRQVLQVALDQQVKRVVHISSTAVYGVPNQVPLIEDELLIGVGAYGQAKIEAELLIPEFREQGLTVSILRPKTFVGPERLGVFALLYDWAASGKNFPILGNGLNRYQLLDVEDLCQAIKNCLMLPKVKVNDVFNIGAVDFGTMREDYQAVLDQAGFGKKVVGLPAKPAIWMLRLLEHLNLSPLYSWVYETAAKDSFVDVSRAQQQLSYQPQYSNQQALLRNFQWYLQHRADFEQESGVNHRVPWKQGALRVAKVFF